MLKPQRGNLFFLMTLLYMLLFPMLFNFIVVNFIPIKGFFSSLSLPALLFVSQLLTVFIPALVYFAFMGGKLAETFPIKKVSIINILFIFGICTSIMPLMGFLSYLGGLLETSPIDKITEKLVDMPYYIALPAIALTPAIFEETLLRGIVFSNYRDVKLRDAAIVNGLFFGIMHGNFQQFFYAFLLGTIFVYFVYYTKSIISSVFAHFFINGSQITYAFLLNNYYKSQGSSLAKMTSTAKTAFTVNDLLILLGFTIPFTVLAFFLLGKFIKHNKLINETATISDIVYADENIDIHLDEKQWYTDTSFFLILIVFVVSATYRIVTAQLK